MPNKPQEVLADKFSEFEALTGMRKEENKFGRVDTSTHIFDPNKKPEQGQEAQAQIQKHPLLDLKGVSDRTLDNPYNALNDPNTPPEVKDHLNKELQMKLDKTKQLQLQAENKNTYSSAPTLRRG